MALPNGVFKDWEGWLSEKPVINYRNLPVVGQLILYGWLGGGRTDLSDAINYITFGDVEIVRALWGPNEFQILIKQRSIKGYFIFNGVG